jgi:putative zinc-binding metallo-peptidase
MNPALDPKSPRDTLLQTPVRDLGLSVEHSPVAPLVRRLVRELRAKGIRRFTPGFYLTDEWGCPSGQPIIGIPFYLAHPTLARIEKERNDLENAREIMMYLRHEAGHAFNYAYRLYDTPRWRDLFGPFRRPYREEYRPVPFSRRFVRHMEGWYAQKHPDEDFAETFAVWLTPGSRWRHRYRVWPALRKLLYVDRVAHRVGGKPPIVEQGKTDVTVSEMRLTVQDFYRKNRQNRAAMRLALEGDLADIFRRPWGKEDGLVPAAEMIQKHRVEMTDKIAYWTGVRRDVVRSLVDVLIRHCRERKLVGRRRRETVYLVELTAYGTALAMNYLTRGRFVLK